LGGAAHQGSSLSSAAIHAIGKSVRRSGPHAIAEGQMVKTLIESFQAPRKGRE